MKIFATSDTHFSHRKLVEYGRPEDFEERQLVALARLSGDLLIHCGDFCIGNNEENNKRFLIAASGFKRKILVRGNHDPQSDNWYLNAGWDFVCESFVNTYFGKKIIFTHIPTHHFPQFDHNIHGHLHGNQHRLEGALAEMYEPGYHIDLAPEIRNYSPVNIQSLL